ncbi:MULTISPECIES: hypothetical protein [Sphingobium]|uniref:Uncharacterized protein n=3 Tax=Sphingobium fuliginis (strain ATCC 27551) TaxID=336203 RepID=A0ABQ1ERQ8_SPHSA|nr:MULTISPECIES: hypothetical protein [Sphingobium]MCB4859259.1 hypothetical protein [Sphingobium sp. PNB]GFZ83598.1 hypothetical protein GCM10019071_10150 [Sphingobium fuliginis]
MADSRRLPAYSEPSRANGKTESELHMFALVAALVFIGSFLLAAGTIIGMFLAYHDKMVAALTFEPIPQETPVYRLRISRRRASPSARQAAPAFAAAVLAA